MRPEFLEHQVLAAGDLEDERAYLDDAYARHLDLVHGTTGDVLVAARVAHPASSTAVGLGSGPAGTALTVSTAVAGGQPAERVRVAGAAASTPAQLVFSHPADAAAAGPAPGTLTLLAGVGNPAATELRIEGRGGAGSARALRVGSAARPLSIDAAGTVTVDDLTVTGKLALGPAPAPAGAGTPDPTGSVAAAEALRRQLAQGLGIGADVGLALAIAGVSLGGGHVGFTVEVTAEQGVAPITITIKGRVNVGTTVAADDLRLLPALLPAATILPLRVDVPIPAGAGGDVIVAVTAYGVHSQRGLVSASEARLLGTV
jgi:hypothetical protein